MVSNAFLEIVGSRCGTGIVVTFPVLMSTYPIWFPGLSVNHTLPAPSDVTNVVATPLYEYDENSCASMENCHTRGADESLIHIEPAPS